MIGIAGPKVTKAMLDVFEERARQIGEEGWSAEHDDKHDRGEMAQAAGCYVVNAVTWAGLIKEGVPIAQIEGISARASCPRIWPWSREWWKPQGQRRNLVKAAALILAEIDRIDRIDRAAKKAGGQ